MTIDVAVIGAGLAGLICAQQLKQAGYQVVVVEKSRGLGGRLATRRLQGTSADHGVPYLENQGPLSQSLIHSLLQQNILQTGSLVEQPGSDKLELKHGPKPCYTAAAGLTAVAKFLAAGLEIWRSQRVQALVPELQTWQLSLEAGADAMPPLTARAVVIAIPAPQALMLLEPVLEQGISPDLVQAVRSVEFDPCFSVIATYAPELQINRSNLLEQAVTLTDSAELAWVSLESTKRPTPFPVLVAQSTAAFAQRYLEAQDLKPIGQRLLEQVSQIFLPEFNNPDELQIHRWRYARVRQPLKERCLATNLPLPLVCSGDWCGGKQVENALESGLAAAYQISHFLDDRTTITSDWEANFAGMMYALATR